MNCPKCQTVCGENDRFCFRCGTPLQSSRQEKYGTHRVPLLILSALAILGICLFFLIPAVPGPTEPLAEEPDMPYFSVTGGLLKFDSSLYTGPSELIVPASLQGQTITGIAPGCFENCTELTTVILPDTLETIGARAFAGCTSLRGIAIPEGVKTLGKEAFSGCPALEAISVPASITAIGAGCFSDCGSLLHIFYAGEFSDWRSLYSEKITLKTQVYCTDGSHLNR